MAVEDAAVVAVPADRLDVPPRLLPLQREVGGAQPDRHTRLTVVRLLRRRAARVLLDRRLEVRDLRRDDARARRRAEHRAPPERRVAALRERRVRARRLVGAGTAVRLDHGRLAHVDVEPRLRVRDEAQRPAIHGASHALGRGQRDETPAERAPPAALGLDRRRQRERAAHHGAPDRVRVVCAGDDLSAARRRHVSAAAATSGRFAAPGLWPEVGMPIFDRTHRRLLGEHEREELVGEVVEANCVWSA